MNRSIKNLKFILCGITLVSLAVSSSHAVLIDFTTAEGYANGILNNQPGSSATWRTSSGGNNNFQVNTAGGGSVSLATTANNTLSGYFEPVNLTLGAPISTSMDFQFSQTAGSTGQATNAFGLVYATGQASGAVNATSASFGRQAGTDTYRISAFGSSTTNITGASLGINSEGTDYLSDVIRLTLTLTYTSATTLSGTVTLYNVNSGATLATLTAGSISYTAPTALYGAMRLGDAMTNSGLSSVSVLNYASPIPEPGTVALTGLGLGMVLFFARRKKAQTLH